MAAAKALNKIYSHSFSTLFSHLIAQMNSLCIPVQDREVAVVESDRNFLMYLVVYAKWRLLDDSTLRQEYITRMFHDQIRPRRKIL